MQKFKFNFNQNLDFLIRHLAWLVSLLKGTRSSIYSQEKCTRIEMLKCILAEKIVQYTRTNYHTAITSVLASGDTLEILLLGIIKKLLIYLNSKY